MFGGGFVAAVTATFVWVAVTGADAQHLTVQQDVEVSAVSSLVQFVAFGALLALVTTVKGRGPRVDLGVVADRVGPVVGAFFCGVALQIGLGIVVMPISFLQDDRQGVVEQLDDAHGLALVGLVVVAAILAPMVEEVLFRGLLLRSLLRRLPAAAAVAVSAGVFATVHLLDLDAAVGLPAFVVLGIVSAVLAVRSGSLARSIALHLGFNALTVVLVVSR